MRQQAMLTTEPMWTKMPQVLRDRSEAEHESGEDCDEEPEQQHTLVDRDVRESGDDRLTERQEHSGQCRR